MNAAAPQIDPLHDTLRRVFGLHEFRPHQREIIEDLIAGRDVFVLMPTGGGKSLCFQMAALHRPGVAIVVSPLIALMKDQVDSLAATGVQAAFYNSSLEATEARRVLARLHAGELDLLYVAPERLMNPDFLQRLAGIDVALIAVDEAHCVSQWGHDFRPEYAALGGLITLIVMIIVGGRATRRDIHPGPVVAAGWLVIGAVSLQMTLGASTVWFGLPLWVATAYNGGAALLLSVINLNHAASFRASG